MLIQTNTEYLQQQRHLEHSHRQTNPPPRRRRPAAAVCPKQQHHEIALPLQAVRKMIVSLAMTKHFVPLPARKDREDVKNNATKELASQGLKSQN